MIYGINKNKFGKLIQKLYIYLEIKSNEKWLAKYKFLQKEPKVK